MRVDHGLPPVNQEIAVEFDEIAMDETGLAVLTDQITLRLEQIGIRQVRILHTAPGVLKISYHSNLDIEFVRTALQKDAGTMVLSHNDERDSFPFSESNEDYKIKVILLQDGQISESSFQGVLVETISFKEHSLKPKFLIYNSFVLSEIQTNIIENRAITYVNIEHPVRVVPYHIPEVRAGPLA